MNKVYRIVLGALFLFFIVSSGFCQVTDEEVPPRYLLSSWADNLPDFLNNAELDYFLSATQGYDNNVNLDSQREGDTYTQMFFQAKMKSALDESTEGILGYEISSMIYSESNEYDLIRNALGAGFDHKINEDLNFSLNYTFGVSDYVNTGEDDYFDHTIEAKFKKNLPENFYHSIGYEFMFKDYQQRKIQRLAGLNTNIKREDTRNGIEYELGKYFTNDLLKARFQFYYNDSNDEFMDYYDYDSYRTILSWTHLFTDKLFGLLSFSRQWRSFEERTIVADPGTKEWDRTYVMTSAFYYNLKEGLNLSLSYSYRQNWSNEPSDTYSGSLITLGANYSF